MPIKNKHLKHAFKELPLTYKKTKTKKPFTKTEFTAHSQMNALARALFSGAR